MITMYTARTSEIDEISEAIDEIKSQIDFSALKKNSGGLIFCHADFIDSGVVAALCDELPFDVIGMTSMASADEHGYGLYDLTLTVLTSDEVGFKAGMTNNIDHENFTTEADRLYKRIRGQVEDGPALIITFIPSVPEVSNCEVLAAMDKSCNGLPIWGSVTNNIDFTCETVQTICNGKALPSSIAMMFLNGPVAPGFIISSIPQRNMAQNRAVVTRSDGAIVREINNLPVMEYLANMGLAVARENIITTPILAYYDDVGEAVALGFYALLDDGSVLAGRELPAGTPVAVGSIDAYGIFESSETGLNRILERKDRRATLLLPCVLRYIMLAPDQEREMRLITKKLAGVDRPFMMGYSGGEICPMPGADGKFHNCFHNYTFCACVL